MLLPGTLMCVEYPRISPNTNPAYQTRNPVSIYDQQLHKMKNQDGFIAALDQSGGSTPKALGLYGVTDDAWSSDEEMFSVVHEMRTRIMTSPSFTGERILAAILFENTMDRDVTLRYPRQLYAKVASLSGYISGHDFAPADAHRAVHEMYKENLGTYMQQMTKIREDDLAAFNRMLRDKGIGTVITGTEGGS